MAPAEQSPLKQPEDDLEELMSHLGEFGRYQFFQFFLHLLSAVTAGVHMLAIVTIAGVPSHRCLVPWAENATEPLPWGSPNVLSAIPKSADDSLSSCLLINPATNLTETCDAWVYDRTYFKSSRTIEWNLVCDRRWMGALTQSSYMFGVFFGALFLGTLADKYGRKKVFYVSAMIQLFTSVGIAFVSNYVLFLITSFVYGIFGSAGAYTSAFVLTMELVGPSKRTVCGVMFQATFALGVMLVAFWAYLIPHDFTTLQLVYGLHSVLLIGHWWLIDESPRWLWSQGRINESVSIVAKGVRINGGPKVDRAYFVSRGRLRQASSGGATAGLTDLFRTPRLRNKTLNVAFNWFANSLAYYSLSLNSDKMLGNPFLVLFVMGLVEIPCYAMVIGVMDRTGRRPLTCTLMIIGALACILTVLIPPEYSGQRALVVFTGKFCISGSFAIIYNYSAELFPTVIRNTSLGFGSMCARVSAMLTPLITLLESFDKRVPTVMFAAFTLASGIMTMFLPETLDQPMPQSIEDGEEFGKGDTCFTTGCFSSRSKRSYEQPKA